MSLTDAQKKEAERTFLLSKLDDHDLSIASEMERVEEMLRRFHEQKVELQNECHHPLIARETKNEGNTGNWDGHDSYWTNHVCTLCGRRWSTTQRWKYVGTKLGLPDDLEARDWDN